MDSIDIEVVLKKCSTLSDERTESLCKEYLANCNVKSSNIISSFNANENKTLHENVEHIVVGTRNGHHNDVIDYFRNDINWHIYTLNKTGPQNEICEDEDGNDVRLATICDLPCTEYFGLWENLIFDIKIKDHLLNYAASMMLFAEKGVNHNIVNLNRVILLHGPPGTGKTSLCKALAYKLAVKLDNRFRHGILVEINSHSLFSKWFSESGKLVTKMFTKIKEYLEDSDTLVCVLIDEVESLAHVREKCLSGAEPSDSIRVVNAVLTQIDQIKQYPNALILTTSNMTEAIDLAFIDRADIKQYIGLPEVEAIYQIYYSCIQELLRTGIIYPNVPIASVHVCRKLIYNELENCDIFEYSRKLFKVSELSHGFSGRTIRKIPFLAHALYIQRPVVTLNDFLFAMERAIDNQKADIRKFEVKKH